MSENLSLPRTLKSLVDERLAAQKRRITGMDSELKAGTTYFGGPGGGDDFELGGVSSLSVPGGDGIEGDVDIAGGEGLAACQSTDTITLLAPRIRHCANPRSPLALATTSTLTGSCIFLHPVELPGSMQVAVEYLQIERDGSPDDQALFIELAVYKRNVGNDGFTREAHFGTPCFNDFIQIASGNVYKLILGSSALLPMGQHFLALLYKYSGSDGYRFGVCEASGAHYPGSGIYQSGSATELPASIPDSDLSIGCTAIVWTELAAD
jgi:hypothetical protein